MESQGPKNLPVAGWHKILVTSDEKRDLEIKRRRSGDDPEEKKQNSAAGPASSQPVPEMVSWCSCPAVGVPPVSYQEMQERGFRGTRYEAELLLTGQASLTTPNPI